MRKVDASRMMHSAAAARHGSLEVHGTLLHMHRSQVARTFVAQLPQVLVAKHVQRLGDHLRIARCQRMQRFLVQIVLRDLRKTEKENM
jgi:hypothetical protein